MSKQELSKREAIILITPVVDNEASEQEKDAFFNFIQDNDEVRRRYESARRVKGLVSSRCPRIKAPDSLCERINMFITSQQLIGENSESADPIYDIPCPGSIQEDNKDISSAGSKITLDYNNWLFSVAVGLFIIFILGGVFYYNQGPQISDETTAYNIEESAFEHFNKHQGSFIEPSYSTASIASAENELAKNYNISIKVPSINNAVFKGVVYSEFVPGYEAPMLEYYLSSDDQYVYVFVFKIDQLEKFGKLVRDKEAIKECDEPQNFHVRNVNGKHVVSWKWDDVWYAAISNHSGDTIASLIDNPARQ